MNSLNEQLIGTWMPDDEDATSTFTIAIHQNQYTVTGIDNSDGEIYKIEDIEWNGTNLSFITVMPSTGCRVKCSLTSHSNIEVVAAITIWETWKKKVSQSATSPKAGKTNVQPAEKRFVGVWVTQNEDSEVIVNIAANGNQYKVTAYGKRDNEQFEIKNVIWDNTNLSFDLRVPSDDFRAKNSFSLISDDQALLELTFNENWMKIEHID